MTDNTTPRCERCGTPTIEEPSRELDQDFMPVMYQVCPLDPKDCELKALRSKCEELEKRNEELEQQVNKERTCMCAYCGKGIPYDPTAEGEGARVYKLMIEHDQVCIKNPLVIRAQEAETKLRAAEDAVVVLRDALENRIVNDEPCWFTPTGYCKVHDRMNPCILTANAALSNTSATAQQRVEAIRREAVEKGAQRMIELYNSRHAYFADETIRAAILGEDNQ